MEENTLFEDMSDEKRKSTEKEIDKDIMDIISKLEANLEIYDIDDKEITLTSMFVDLDDVDDNIEEFKTALYNDSINAIIPYSLTCRDDIYSQAVYWLNNYKKDNFVYNMSYFMYFANLSEVQANFQVMWSEIVHNKEIDINFENYKQYEGELRLNKQMKYIRGCFDILRELYHSDNVPIKEKVNEYLENFAEGYIIGRGCPLFKMLQYQIRIERYYKKQYHKALCYAIETRLKENNKQND